MSRLVLTPTRTAFLWDAQCTAASLSPSSYAAENRGIVITYKKNNWSTFFYSYTQYLYTNVYPLILIFKLNGLFEPWFTLMWYRKGARFAVFPHIALHSTQCGCPWNRSQNAVRLPESHRMDVNTHVMQVWKKLKRVLHQFGADAIWTIRTTQTSHCDVHRNAVQITCGVPHALWAQAYKVIVYNHFNQLWTVGVLHSQKSM